MRFRLGGRAGLAAGELRLQLLDASAAEIPIREECVRRTTFSIEGGRESMHALLAAARGRMPTALLTANDYVAAGALRACAETGLRVPDDLSIVGFDDIDVAHATAPALTTVHQPLRELGRAAAHVVLQIASGADSESVVLEPTLVVRDSTGTV